MSARSWLVGADAIKGFVRWWICVLQKQVRSIARRRRGNIDPRLEIRRALKCVKPVEMVGEPHLPDAVAGRAGQILRWRRNGDGNVGDAGVREDGIIMIEDAAVTAVS